MWQPRVLSVWRLLDLNVLPHVSSFVWLTDVRQDRDVICSTGISTWPVVVSSIRHYPRHLLCRHNIRPAQLKEFWSQTGERTRNSARTQLNSHIYTQISSPFVSNTTRTSSDLYYICIYRIILSFDVKGECREGVRDFVVTIVVYFLMLVWRSQQSQPSDFTPSSPTHRRIISRPTSFAGPYNPLIWNIKYPAYFAILYASQHTYALVLYSIHFLLVGLPNIERGRYYIMIIISFCGWS